MWLLDSKFNSVYENMWQTFRFFRQPGTAAGAGQVFGDGPRGLFLIQRSK